MPKKAKRSTADFLELAEAFIDISAHLIGATSSYKEFAGNSKRAGRRDALYTTRLRDYKRACARARKMAKKLVKQADHVSGI